MSNDQDILWLGRQDEGTHGRRNFLELFSVFVSPPLFSVLHGRQELGYVDEMTFLGRHENQHTLLLGGRAWLVNHVDWQRRVAYVEGCTAPCQALGSIDDPLPGETMSAKTMSC